MTTGSGALRVLMITAVWPTAEHPERVPFIVRHVAALRRKGLSIDIVHLDGQGRLSNYVNRWREVRARLSESRYDVIHAQWGQAGLVALPRRAPLVITFQGSDLEGHVGEDGHYTLGGKFLTVLSRFAAHRADRRIVVSQRLGDRLGNLPYRVIPGGLDLQLFRPIPMAEARVRLELSPDRRYILFAASPAYKVKRHGLAVEAVAALDAGYDAHLLVTEGVSPSLMPVYMSACNALLLTSLHEGSPNVVKEALACNLPVVTVDVGDVRERIGHVAGCVITADDRPATIAAALAELFDRAGVFRGREAVTHLDEDLLTDEVVSIYREAIEHYHRRA